MKISAKDRLTSGNIVKGPFPDLPPDFAEKKNRDLEFADLAASINKALAAARFAFGFAHGSNRPPEPHGQKFVDKSKTEAQKSLVEAQEALSKMVSMIKELP